MKPAIKHLNLDAEFYTPEGCYITEQSNASDDPDLSIARARVAPGITTRRHGLKNTTERYYILKGIAMVEAGDLPPTTISAGDIVIIPPMCPQRITNTGTEDLVFLAICAPRFQNEAYEDLEDT